MHKMFIGDLMLKIFNHIRVKKCLKEGMRIEVVTGNKNKLSQREINMCTFVIVYRNKVASIKQQSHHNS